MSESCIICASTLMNIQELPTGAYNNYDCPRCGKFRLSFSATQKIKSLNLVDDPKSISNLSYSLKHSHLQTPITTFELDNFLKTSLPPLPDQLNNLVRYIGENSNPGQSATMNTVSILSIIGTIDSNALRLLVATLDSKGYLDHFQMTLELPDDLELELSYLGWEYFIELQGGKLESKKVFMAMQYGKDELDKLVEHNIKPAVSATGFTLERLDENKQAGLIDSKLRVAIRTSQLLIADLTHDNNGAYWEAGYAEGLGIPVVYICEKEKFDGSKSHFDTNHHLTVIWDKDNLPAFVDELKAVIRATLPESAALEET